jgi:hypothetical protein
MGILYSSIIATGFHWQHMDRFRLQIQVLYQISNKQLLNQKDITLASGKPALQFDYFYQPVITQPNGDLGTTFTQAGNQLYIGGIAIIENGILYAVTYSPEIAQNNADYMKQILDMANSL